MAERAGLTLIGGGARCGKSAFALELARSRGERRALLATAEPLDAEMAARIAAHKAERGADFRTLEAPLELAAALRASAGADVIVIDCLTLWLSNLLLRDLPEPAILDRLEQLIAAAAEVRRRVIVVTSEVGLGLVPESALGRAFRDLAGRAHQRLGQAADEIYFAVLGVILRLQPEPLLLQRRIA